VTDSNGPSRKVLWALLRKHRDSQLTVREWKRLFPSSSPLALLYKPLIGLIADRVCWDDEGSVLVVKQLSGHAYAASPLNGDGGGTSYDCLTVSDIQLFEIDWKKFAEALAVQFALDVCVAEVFPHFWRLGSFVSIGKEATYFFCMLNIDEPVCCEKIQRNSSRIRKASERPIVLCPFNEPALLKRILSGSSLQPVFLSETDDIDLREQTYPKTFMFNDEQFTVELPVTCSPYYDPDVDLWDYFPDVDRWDPIYIPGSEVPDSCDLHYVGEHKTIRVKVNLEHPQKLFPTQMLSAPQTASDDSLHTGYLFVGNRKYKADEIRIVENRADIIAKVRLEQQSRTPVVSDEGVVMYSPSPRP